jgi:hypothetical protein
MSVLGYSAEEVAALKAAGATEELRRAADAE